MILEKRKFLRIPIAQVVDVWFSPDEKRRTGILKNLSAQGAAILLATNGIGGSGLVVSQPPTTNPQPHLLFHINMGEENDFLLQGSIVRQSGNLFGLLLKTDFMEEQNLRKALDEFVRALGKCA